jgi:flagellar biosynthesis GTPase FlhF
MHMQQQQPRRFQAASLDEAYGQVRDALGDEAVILATRRATSPSLHGHPAHSFVEVLAHIPEPPIGADQQVPGSAGLSMEQASATPDLSRSTAPVNPELLARVQQAQRAPITAAEADLAESVDIDVEQAADELLDVAAVHSQQRSDLSDLLQEVGEMRGMVEQLSRARVDALVDDGPVPLKRLRAQLRLQGVTNRLASVVLDKAASGLTRASGARGTSDSAAQQTVERELAGLLPARPHLDLLKRPAVIPLVGPAGSGKTTLAMRLALDLMRSYSLRVVVAGTDVERAGAPQQLTALGAAAGVATRLCYTPGELQALVAEPGVDAVVVDTPGHDGTRKDRMAELQAFIHAARQREVLLVLPATMKTLDLEAAARAYAAVQPSGVVLTRCDATSTFGEPFSALAGAGLGLAFTTHDGAVTSAPRPGDNLALARAILSGHWPAPPSETVEEAGRSERVVSESAPAVPAPSVVARRPAA